MQNGKKMPPKTITYRSYKNFTEEQFKEAIRSDCSYIDDGNLASLHHVIKKRLDQFPPVKKMGLHGNNKSQHDISIKKSCHEKISS